MTPVITPDRYEELVEELHRHDDITRLSTETHMDEEALLVIYTQKVTRDATRRYYRIKSRAPKYYHQWRSGKPLMKFARENRFPPILTALIILLEGDMTRKGFWRLLQNPGKVPDARLRREIKEIVRNDPIYSPAGAEVQAQRGRHGEERLQDWLDEHDVGYRDEEELRGTCPKIPSIQETLTQVAPILERVLVDPPVLLLGIPERNEIVMNPPQMHLVRLTHIGIHVRRPLRPSPLRASPDVERVSFRTQGKDVSYLQPLFFRILFDSLIV